MKKHVMQATDGTYVTFFSPETPEEAKQLKELERRGKISSKASFGDWKTEKKQQDEKV
jgi:hypothetical protein